MGSPTGGPGEIETVLRTVIGGVVVAVIAGVLAFVGGAIGITTLWPVLLAAAIALAAGPAVVSRVASFAIGSVVGFLSMALVAAVLPQITISQAIAVVLAVVVVTVVAAVSQGLLPLWAGLAGYAAFVGLYLPSYEASPTSFASEAPVALLTLLLATGVGALVAVVAELVGADVPHREEPHVGVGSATEEVVR